MPELIVDGFDLGTLGLKLEPRTRDVFSDASLDFTTAPVPGRAGTAHLSRRGQVRPRPFTVPAYVEADDAIALELAVDEIKYRLSRGDRQLIFPHHDDRYITARLLRPRWLPVAPDYVQTVRRMALQFLAADPWFYESAQQSIVFSTATAMPIGNAITLPVITLVGAVTDPVITYKDGSGATIRTMGFTVTMTGGDTLVIDCDDMKLTLNAGASTDAGLLTSGDFIELDPDDFTDWLSGDPTLEVSPAPATSATAVYRKAWR